MNPNTTIKNNHPFLFNLPLAFIYLTINLLFVWKYLSNFLSPGWLLPVLYTIITSIILFLPLNKNRIKLPSYNTLLQYFSTVAIFTVFLIWLMLQLDPNQLDVARYPALHNWIDRLLAGEFPYSPGGYPSGFPFLFILAIPFYLMGDLGLIQIFAFVAFSVIVYFKYKNNYIEAFRIIILLIASPIFLYEVAVRSELFSNITAILLYLTLFEIFCEKDKKGLLTLVILGMIGGLLLSTRGIVLIIYIIFFGYMLLRYRYRYIIFGSSIVIGFALTIIPFLIWNCDHFIAYGPLTIQMWYIPAWFLALALICSVACIFIVKTTASAFYAISIILFGIVLCPFMEQVFIHGLTETVMGNFFDISYFCFALPFLLLSFRRVNVKT